MGDAVSKLHRRLFLTGAAGLGAGALAIPAAARAANLSGIETAALRGSISATEVGITAGTLDDQSRAFAKLIEKSAETDAPIFLPPGTYVVSNITLP